MAQAKITCGACGGRVRISDSSCPHCGAPVEFERQGREKTVPDRPESPVPGRRPEAWVVIAAAAVAILLVVLIMGEVNREHAPPASAPVSAAGEDPHIGDLRREVSRLEEEAAARNDDPGLLLALANRLHDLGMSDPAALPRAIDVYTRYLGQRPDDPNARVDMGICYFELGRQDSLHGAQYVAAAVREMRRVADAEPGHQPAAFNLGVVHLFLGATEESSDWFRKAVAIAPDTPLGKRAGSLLEQHTFPAQGTP